MAQTLERHQGVPPVISKRGEKPEVSLAWAHFEENALDKYIEYIDVRIEVLSLVDKIGGF